MMQSVSEPERQTCPLCSGDGWYIPNKEPTDEQIDELIISLEGSVDLEISVWQKEFHAVVRRWLSTL